MSSVVRFAPALGDWIRQHLEQGGAPAELLLTMQARAIPADAAHAIVGAFVAARRDGTPLPIDAVEVPDITVTDDDANCIYREALPRLRRDNRLQLGDRVVRVAARAQRPTLAVLGDVLDADECGALIDMARARMRPSTIVDPSTGRNVVTGTRTSSGMFFRLFENAFIERLDRRMAEIMNLPPEHGEGLQVLHYSTGAGSAPHFDFLVPSNAANQASIARSGQRVSTLVIYLNDVPAGGETVFPAVNWSVSPQRGNAVYFEYCNRFGDLDHASLHASQPVEQGEKWVATKWMRTQEFICADAATAGASGMR